LIYTKSYGCGADIHVDIQPKKDSLTISLRKGRNESTINHTVKTAEDIENVKPHIANAFEIIK